MDFALNPRQQQRRQQGRVLARDLGDSWTAAHVIQQARAVEFFGPDADGVADVLFLEAAAAEGKAGPSKALVVQTDATTYVPLDWGAAVDGYGNLILTPEA